MGKKSAKSGPIFYEGQKEMAAKLFSEGGIFSRLMSGEPIIGVEQASNLRQQGVSRQFASRGQEGDPLQARAIADAEFKTGVQRESGQLEALLAAIQPAGAGGKDKSGGFWTK